MSACSGRRPFVPYKSAAVGGPLHRALLGELVEETTTLSDLVADSGPPVQLPARVFTYRDQQGAPRNRLFALHRRPQTVTMRTELMRLRPALLMASDR